MMSGWFLRFVRSSSEQHLFSSRLFFAALVAFCVIPLYDLERFERVGLASRYTFTRKAKQEREAAKQREEREGAAKKKKRSSRRRSKTLLNALSPSHAPLSRATGHRIRTLSLFANSPESMSLKMIMVAFCGGRRRRKKKRGESRKKGKK